MKNSAKCLSPMHHDDIKKLAIEFPSFSVVLKGFDI